VNIPALLDRMKSWQTSPVILADRRIYGCEICNDRKKSTELRGTVVGEVCLECFLSLPPCSSCGIGVGIMGVGRELLCASCLNPDPTPDDYEREFRRLVGRRDNIYEVQIERLVWAESIEIK